MSRSRWAVALRALLILIAWSTWMSEDFSPFDPSESAEAGQYDRPAKNPHQSRSVVIAKHGIVAELPDGEDPSVVITWLIVASTLLRTVVEPGEDWIALVHEPDA